MAEMTDEEFKMYQRYGPNYRSRMRFGRGARTTRSRHQFNPGGSFYHTDPDRTIQRVESIMGAPPPAKTSPYLSDYLEEYEATRQRVLQLEELMYQNQFQNSYQDISFEDFYNNYYGDYYGDYGSGYQDAAPQEQIQPNPLYAPEITEEVSTDRGPARLRYDIQPLPETSANAPTNAQTRFQKINSDASFGINPAQTAVSNFIAAQQKQNNAFAFQQAQAQAPAQTRFQKINSDASFGLPGPKPAPKPAPAQTRFQKINSDASFGLPAPAPTWGNPANQNPFRNAGPVKKSPVKKITPRQRGMY